MIRSILATTALGALLATGAFAFSTGDAIHVDGGFHVQRL